MLGSYTRAFYCTTLTVKIRKTPSVNSSRDQEYTHQDDRMFRLLVVVTQSLVWRLNKLAKIKPAGNFYRCLVDIYYRFLV